MVMRVMISNAKNYIIGDKMKQQFHLGNRYQRKRKFHKGIFMQGSLERRGTQQGKKSGK